jgi:8-oxo-dGTP diphosphatase
MMTVVCGILVWNDKVLIGKRKSNNKSYPGKWEFPGGKVDMHESISEAVKREWKEELDIEVQPIHQLRTLSNDDIEFIPFILKLISGKAKMLDHDEIRFVERTEFLSMDLTKLSKEAGQILFGSYGIFLKGVS